MLKRICDRCGKEIVDNFWVRIKCDKMTGDDGYTYCSTGTYDFCENCYSDFFAQFANNN